MAGQESASPDFHQVNSLLFSKKEKGFCRRKPSTETY